MALINCSECEKQISDKAASCPHCGAPLEEDTEYNLNRYSNNSSVDGEETFMGRIFIYIKILLKVGVLFFVILYVAPFFFSDKNNSSPGNGGVSSNNQGGMERPDFTSMDQFTAQELTDTYEKNTVLADQQFKGKWILMEGVVSSIRTDISSDAYVTFNVTNSFYSPQAKFVKGENNKLASLIKGQNIRVLCIGDGDVLKTPMLKNCTLVN